jgi:uncharacterized protein
VYYHASPIFAQAYSEEDGGQEKQPMNNLDPSQLNAARTEIARRIKKLTDEPFVVAIMGQTGVGKSSLINALFNVNLKTDPVRPCTAAIESVPVTNDQKHVLSFIDMPGIGESDGADERYLRLYVEYLRSADIIIWALHADNRSVTFDKMSLNKLIASFAPEERSLIFNKITFVLTKADVIHVTPWVVLDKGRTMIFTPGDETIKVLREKQRYYYEQFIAPYQSLLVSETYNDLKCNIQERGFTVNEFFVRYDGVLDADHTKVLCQKYSRYEAIFKRLYNNHLVIPCSSAFNYGLYQVLSIIVNKLGEEAMLRFRNFASFKDLNAVPRERALKQSNITIISEHKGVTFDLAQGIYKLR